MPYFSDSGEMRDPDLYDDVGDHAAPRPTEPTAPTATTPRAAPKPGEPTITRERTVQETVAITALAPEDALAEWDRMQDARLKDPGLADERTEAGRAFQERQDALIMRGKGLTPEENRVLGTIHEGGRLRPPEAEAPGTYEELPDQGVVADRPEQDAVLSVARNLEAEPLVRDFLSQAAHIRASGPPPDDITLHQQLTAAWPTLAERQAVDARLDDLHAAVDRMLAEQGVKPAQRERWLSELTQLEEYGPTGIKYLLGPFTEDLWSRGPAAFADAHAAVQGEAYEAEQTRLAQAQQSAPDDPQRIVSTGGRA